MILLSQYRKELMGLAMILIMISHLPGGLFSTPWQLYLSINARGGTDIFFLLSGMGLVYTFKKNADVKTFYYKRAIRIFPFLILFITCSLPLQGDVTLIEYLLMCSTIGYWIGYGTINWFIPTIVVLYLIFPLLYKIETGKYSYYFNILILISYIALLLLSIKDEEFYRTWMRMPVFCLGLIIGRQLFISTNDDGMHKMRKESFLYIITFVLGILLSVYLFYLYSIMNPNPRYIVETGYVYKPFPLIVIGFCLFVGFLFKTILDWGGRFILSSFAFIGEMSYELYLTHTQVYQSFIYDSTISNLALKLGVILIVFPIAYIFHIINKRIMKALLAISNNN